MSSDDRSSTLSVLRVPAVRRVLASDAISGSGDVTYWIALIVYLLDRPRGGLFVTLAVVARLLPRVAFGALGGSVADRFDRRHLMMTLDATRAVLMFAMAAMMTAGGTPFAVLAIVFATCTVSTPYRPAVSAGYPHIVTEDRLAAANALSNTVGQVIGLSGPLVGAVLLSVSTPAVAVAVNAATYLVSIVLLAGVDGLGRAAPTDGKASSESRLRMGIRQARDVRGVRAIVGIVASMMLLRGFEMVLHVRVAVDQFEFGDAGYGWISAALGVGALLAAARVSRIATTERPGVVLVASAAVGCATLAALSVVRSPALGLSLLVVEGASTVVFEVIALTLTQRICRADVLGTVLGVQNSVSGLAKLTGSLLAPFSVFAVGLSAALALMGLLVAACLALVAPAVIEIGAVAGRRRAELDPIVDALRQAPALVDVERPALERLAMTATSMSVLAATDIVVQGAPADNFYVIDVGEFVVRKDGSVVNRLAAGDSFGEIGLLNRAPRSATVVSTTDADMWRIPGDAFIRAATSSAVVPSTAIDGLDAHVHDTAVRRGDPTGPPVGTT